MIDLEDPLSYFAISLVGGVHIGARALLEMNLIQFACYIANLLQWWGGGVFYLFKLFLLAAEGLEGGSRHPVVRI
jgi:hypothetical protein